VYPFFSNETNDIIQITTPTIFSTVSRNKLLPVTYSPIKLLDMQRIFVASFFVGVCCAFAPSPGRPLRSAPLCSTIDKNDRKIESTVTPFAFDDEEFAVLRDEIEELKDTARRRAEEVSARMSIIAAEAAVEAATEKEAKEALSLEEVKAKAARANDIADEVLRAAGVATEDIKLKGDVKVVENEKKRRGEDEAAGGGVPLIGSQWKIQMNVGREPGTWMPKTWGISGERLFLNLELRLEADQMYERDSFIGGTGGFRRAHLFNGEVTLAPSMGEGARNIMATDGGWRVVRGEGPGGTDAMRFYIDIEEEVRHKGKDVYVPVGRVYFLGGYFELEHKGKDKVKLMEKEYKLKEDYKKLGIEVEKEGFFSIKKVQLIRDKFTLMEEISKCRRMYRRLKMREPDLSDLRLLKDNTDVALGKEGSMYISVPKGMFGKEHHILGKFALVSTVPHDDTRSP